MLTEEDDPISKKMAFYCFGIDAILVGAVNIYLRELLLLHVFLDKIRENVVHCFDDLKYE